MSLFEKASVVKIHFFFLFSNNVRQNLTLSIIHNNYYRYNNAGNNNNKIILIIIVIIIIILSAQCHK